MTGGIGHHREGRRRIDKARQTWRELGDSIRQSGIKRWAVRGQADADALARIIHGPEFCLRCPILTRSVSEVK